MFVIFNYNYYIVTQRSQTLVTLLLLKFLYLKNALINELSYT